MGAWFCFGVMAGAFVQRLTGAASGKSCFRPNNGKENSMIVKPSVSFLNDDSDAQLIVDIGSVITGLFIPERFGFAAANISC
jgi:hypothetical protein